MQNGIMYIKRAFFYGKVGQRVEELCSCTASQNPTSSVCHPTSARDRKPGASLEEEEQRPPRREGITPFSVCISLPPDETITGSRGSLTLESKLKTELLLKGRDLSVNSTSINIMV